MWVPSSAVTYSIVYSTKYTNYSDAEKSELYYIRAHRGRRIFYATFITELFTWHLPIKHYKRAIDQYNAAHGQGQASINKVYILYGSNSLNVGLQLQF
jgi:hypothetical protein